jgi:hydroxymethylpyrimidine/phosphomethylpyrimidine kinase
MPPDTPITLRIISLFGLIVFIAVAFAFSESRRKISWRLAASSLGLQFAFGLIVLHTEAGKAFFDLFKAGFDVMTDASAAASQFLFGNLSNFFLIDSVVAPGEGGALAPAKGYPISAVFAFRVLPLIVFVSGVAGILQHLGAIQAVVRGLSWLMRRTLKTSGAETFGVALQVFMGIESISAQSGYIKTMTRSELFTIMTSFLATIAASVMVAYANFGAEPGHLVAASLMSAPASILMAKLLVPELDRPLTLAAGGEEIQVESHNVFDAAAQGAALGVQIAINVGALLIVFVGLIYLMDQASLKQPQSLRPGPRALDGLCVSPRGVAPRRAQRRPRAHLPAHRHQDCLQRVPRLPGPRRLRERRRPQRTGPHPRHLRPVQLRQPWQRRDHDRWHRQPRPGAPPRDSAARPQGLPRRHARFPEHRLRRRGDLMSAIQAAVPRALTIAGSDSGGGAGIQADLKTFHALGCYGMSVITSITAQNTLGVTGIHDVPPPVVAQQLEAVLSDIGADAAKTGMLSNPAIVHAVAEALEKYPIEKLVLDPVMISKSGHTLLQHNARGVLVKLLFPKAYLVTPNVPEAEVLTGIDIRSGDDLRRAGDKLLTLGPRHVLMKGGHLDSDQATDWLFDGSAWRSFSAPRIDTRHTHGTGCTYAAALTAGLACGLDLGAATAQAKAYLTEAIRRAPGLGQGHGPLAHWAHIDTAHGDNSH